MNTMVCLYVNDVREEHTYTIKINKIFKKKSFPHANTGNDG